MNDERETLRKLSLEEKAGMVFMLAYAGDRVDQARRLISDYHIGGCYLSRDNASTPQAAARLSVELQSFRRGAAADLPLLLGVDQEGAWAAFVPESATGPGNLALGAASDPELTRAMYRVIASEIGAVGYNTLLAPCVDVNSNPENPILGMRSFGGSTPDVARHAAAAVLGAREGGALTTAKHFPGHGNTITDSHRGLPRVERSRNEIDDIDLPPFRAAVAAGVDIVMTSHILYPAIDQRNPATLSSAILQQLLRREMGFEGLILSDSMNMGAIRKNYRPEEAATCALRSGVDMIMLAEEHYDHDAERYFANQVAMIESVARMARTEESAMLRLDEAVLRILATRRRASERSNAHAAAGVDGPAAHGGAGAANSAADRDGTDVGSAAHRAVEREAAERAVWLVQNRRALLPLGKDATIAIVPLSPRSAYSILTQTRGIGPNQRVPAADAFIQTMRASHAKTHVQPVESLLETGRPDAGTAKADVVIAVIEEYPLPGVSFDKSAVEPGLSRLKPVADRLVLVGLCDPYLASRYAERAGACICTSSSRECAAVAAARALTGAFTPGGSSPMRFFS